MGCTYFSGPGFVGHICHGDHWLSLEPFGAKVWCDDHNYLGPTFYRSESAIKVIEKPSMKTWAAYAKWRETLRPNAMSTAQMTNKLVEAGKRGTNKGVTEMNFETWWKNEGNGLCSRVEKNAARKGYEAGQHDMQERAAKVCDEEYVKVAVYCAEEIRDLKVEE